MGCWSNNVLTATLVLVHSTEGYCVLAWSRSSHTRVADPAINCALWTVTGCLRPTPEDYLPTLAGIQLPEFRRKRATLSRALRAMEPRHLLHLALICPSSGNAQRLKSDTHLCPPHNSSSVHLTTTTAEVQRSKTDHRWNMEWLENTTRLPIFTVTSRHPHSCNGPAMYSVGPT